ncbi:failed axon connections isoform X3 [Diorhabda carinulata]|uniref:failed axon connections isoform X2 n=1 Tax=Diorhabda sublineata TaxID=1163346 RepID=UPI0024E183D4|nr:failed axon connections isoform X2 [Diorhabda sublineata]XP_057657740.1 failed axon connections isoform X3 [Diorhabda carinulata]
MATEVENNAPETKEIKEEIPSGDNKAEEAGKQDNAGGDAPTPKEKEPAPPKVLVHKSNFEKDVVYLYQFSRTPLLPSLSPYCLKVETWLRLAGVKYENVDHKMKYRSKKGQLPFIELNGEEIADSAIIMKELSQRFGHDLDICLSAEQRNLAHTTISMIENHLAWVVMWWRTKFPDQVLKGYKVNLQHALGTRIPNGILNFFFKFAFGRKGTKKVKAQGMGVHSAEEINEFGQQDLKVLSDMLADKPFFFGDEPTNLDVVVFAHLAQIYFIDKEVSYPLRDYMTETCPNLVGLVNRMKERCFPDWDDICTTLDLNSHLPKPKAEESKDNKEESKDEKEGDKEKEPEEKDLEKEKADEKEKDKANEKSEENKEKEGK